MTNDERNPKRECRRALLCGMARSSFGFRYSFGFRRSSFGFENCGHGEPPFAFCACIGTMNCGIGAPASGPEQSLLDRVCSRRTKVRRSGSWKAPSALRPCIGTMNLIVLLLVLVLETKPLHRGRE